MKCAYCGKDFELVTNRGLRKYCSHQCYYKARYRREHPKQAKQKICPMCGKEFEAFYDQRKYCSSQCRHKAANNHRRKHTESHERTCKCCGKPFMTAIYNQIYCSAKCRKQAENLKRHAIKAIPEIPTMPPPKVEVKPPEPPKIEPPKIIIPAAIAENRKPTVEELLDWIFSKERTTA